MPNKLREIRKESDCRMWELAARSGVSASTLSAIERYGYKPSIATKQRIADALGVPLQDIWPEHTLHSAGSHKASATA